MKPVTYLACLIYELNRTVYLIKIFSVNFFKSKKYSRQSTLQFYKVKNWNFSIIKIYGKHLRIGCPGNVQ